MANLTRYKQWPYNNPKLGVKAVADPEGEWVKFENIKEFLKTSHNTRMVAALREKYLPGTDRDSRWYNQAIDDCIETLQRLNA